VDIDTQTYEELKRVAQRLLRHERRDHTLQPTALVHEAYLHVAKQRASLDRNGFLALAAPLMRRILVDHARRRLREKRGGGKQRLTLSEATVLGFPGALGRMEEEYGRAAKVVELRFFGGLCIEEVAAALGVSPRTVNDDWRFARAWLRRRLAEGSSGSSVA
jgi:RNA polymerase sigma factor (TIGR02999 family)